MKFLSDTSIDFLRIGKIAFVLSAVLIVFSVALFFVRGPSWGTDFTGGTLVHVRFDSLPSEMKIRQTLHEGGYEAPGVQRFTDAEAAIIRIGPAEVEEEEGSVANHVGKLLAAGFAQQNPEILRTEMVGPAVGDYLRERALWAFLLAFGGIIIYVAWRFKGGVWGLSAVIALIHDVIIVFGLLMFLGITIDLVVVAALLTLAGYSVNDSIVVYDRIRENIKLHYKKPLGEIINLSINETLSRTVITSGTTLAVVIALLLRGGEVLHGFAVALCAGILIGTFSSIFVAAPLVYAWQHKK